MPDFQDCYGSRLESAPAPPGATYSYGEHALLIRHAARCYGYSGKGQIWPIIFTPQPYKTKT